jgi:Xaa-Pro aminopeptidase
VNDRLSKYDDPPARPERQALSRSVVSWGHYCGLAAFVPTGPVSRAYGDAAETRAKLELLRGAMSRAEFDAVYLEGWANVAWLCGGRGNRVVLSSSNGLLGIVVGLNGAWLLAPNNEEARLRAEVFAGVQLPVVTRAWYQLPLWQGVLSLLPENARWASDCDAPDSAPAEALVAPLRRRLTEPETQRYRTLGQDSAQALEAALQQVESGWTELEVAGTIAAALKASDVEPSVLLVGSRARAERFRHLVPTTAPAEDGVIASITAVRHGLHASLTRTVSFGNPPELQRERHGTVLEVDRAYLKGSSTGKTLGSALREGELMYQEAGYYDEWKEHHQGGTTGYAGREVFALPASDYQIESGMALAWNPTVPGAKSEDTVLVREDGLELLSAAPGSVWPVLSDANQARLPRPDILIL